MKSTSFGQALKFAALLSGGFYILAIPISLLFPATLGLRVILALSFLIYIHFILRHSPRKSGQICIQYSLAAAFLLLVGLGFPVFVILLLGAGAIWGTRALYWHSGPASVLLDALLVGCSLFVFISGFLTIKGIFAAMFAFYAMQALSVFLAASPDSGGNSRIEPADRFALAYKTAQDTLGGR